MYVCVYQVSEELEMMFEENGKYHSLLYYFKCVCDHSQWRC